jgi:hypothetical protein
MKLSLLQKHSLLFHPYYKQTNLIHCLLYIISNSTVLKYPKNKCHQLNFHIMKNATAIIQSEIQEYNIIN